METYKLKKLKSPHDSILAVRRSYKEEHGKSSEMSKMYPEDSTRRETLLKTKQSSLKTNRAMSNNNWIWLNNSDSSENNPT